MKANSIHKIISVFAVIGACILLSCNMQAGGYESRSPDAFVKTKGILGAPLLLYAALQTGGSDAVSVDPSSSARPATPQNRWAEIKDLIEVVAAFLTLLAIIVGGTWSYLLFIRTRQKYPSANISQGITYRVITPEKVWIRVAVTLQNTGKVLLSLVEGKTWIQQVLPLDQEIREKIESLEDPVLEGDSLIRWLSPVPPRTLRWGKGEHEIEPSETDQVYFDFIVDAELRTIVIYSYFVNVKKFRLKKALGWQITKVYDLNPHTGKNLKEDNNHGSSPSASVGAAAQEAGAGAGQRAGETEGKAEAATSEEEIGLTGTS